MEIREATADDAPVLADVIRRAFRAIAQRLDITPDNCPTHPSNCMPDWVEADLDKGVVYFILYEGDAPQGCVALERADEKVCYLRRLAVLPEYQGNGYGLTLVNHVLSRAKEIGCTRVEIALVAGDTDLRAWYERRGFVFRKIARYEHLPFTVLFMYTDV